MPIKVDILSLQLVVSFISQLNTFKYVYAMALIAFVVSFMVVVVVGGGVAHSNDKK